MKMLICLKINYDFYFILLNNNNNKKHFPKLKILKIPNLLKDIKNTCIGKSEKSLF